MKTLSLTFGPRLQLVNLIGNATGPISKITPLQSVWNQLAFTDSENSKIKTIDLGNGKTSFQTPLDDPKFGEILTYLEDSHAEAVLRELDSHQSFRVTDLGWVEEVRKQLKGSV